MTGNFQNNHRSGWKDMSFSGFNQRQFNYHDQIPHGQGFNYTDSRFIPHQMPGPRPTIPTVAPLQPTNPSVAPLQPTIPTVAPLQRSQPVVCCEICEVTVPSKNMEEHKNGKRHRRLLKISIRQESRQIPNSQMNPVVQPKTVLKSKKIGCQVENVNSKATIFKYKNVKNDTRLNFPAEGSERKLRDNTGAKDRGFKRKIGGARGGKYMKMNNGIRRPMESSKPDVNALSNSAKSLVQKPALTPPSGPMASPIRVPTPVVGSSSELQFQHFSASQTQVSKGKEHHEIQNPTMEINDQSQSTLVELHALAGSNISARTEVVSCDFAAIAMAPPQGPMTSQVFTPTPAVESSFEPKNQIVLQPEVSEGKEHHEIQNHAVETNDQPQSISMELHAPAGSNTGTLTEDTGSDSGTIVIVPPQEPIGSQVCTPPPAVGSSFELKNQHVLQTEVSEGKVHNEIQNHTVDSNDQSQSISVELHAPAVSNINTKSEDVNSDSAAVAIAIAPLAFAQPQAVGSSFEPQIEHVLHTEIEPKVSEAIANYESQNPTEETNIERQPSVLMEFDAPSGVSTSTQTADGSYKAEAKMDALATELGITQLSKVYVCLKCGDEGFRETLVFCNKCQGYALHRYCLDGPVIFTDDVIWFCEDCEEDVVDTDPHDQCTLLPSGTSDVVNLAKDASQARIELTDCTERVCHKQQQQNICEAMVVETSSHDQCSLLTSERSDSADSAKDACETSTELTNCIKRVKGNKQQQQNIAAEKEVLLTDCHSPSHHGQSQTRNDCDEEEKFMKDCQPVSNGEANSSEGSVTVVDPLPIADPIWRGSLYICNQSYSTITGLLAHMSALACTKVLEETRLFPEVLRADLLQRSAVWPKSFMKCGQPNDRSIGLYFFPENERVERTFDKLVDGIISHDLAIRAVVENAELLVFPSTVLPIQFRRFQAKYYLWGAFIAKQTSPKPNDDAVCGEDTSVVTST